MELYEKPVMNVELFLEDIVTTSDDPPVGCGAADDELPIIPFAEDEEDWTEE